MHSVYDFPLTFAEPESFSFWPNQCSRDECLGLLRSFFGAFSVYPFKDCSAQLLVLRIRNNEKAECGIVFDFIFSLCDGIFNR